MKFVKSKSTCISSVFRPCDINFLQGIWVWTKYVIAWLSSGWIRCHFAETSKARSKTWEIHHYHVGVQGRLSCHNWSWLIFLPERYSVDGCIAHSCTASIIIMVPVHLCPSVERVEVPNTPAYIIILSGFSISESFWPHNIISRYLLQTYIMNFITNIDNFMKDHRI